MALFSALFAEHGMRQNGPDTIDLYGTPPKQHAVNQKKAVALAATPYDALIFKYAANENLDPYLIKCLIKVESDFNPHAISSAGAMGLMQLMPDTARMYHLAKPFDPEQNIRAGTKHLAGLLKNLNHNIPLSLAAYHAGLGRVKKSMSVPPIKSTIAYVKRIMWYYDNTYKMDDFETDVHKLYMRIGEDGTVIFEN